MEKFGRNSRLLGLVAIALLLSGSVASTHPWRAEWSTWQGDKAGSRHNPAEYRINPVTAGKLELKWAFGYPKTQGPPKSQPALVDGKAYFGSPDGKFYATDAKTGVTKWTFDLASVGGGPAVVLDSPTVARGKVYFGDDRGYVYALDQRTGKPVWAKDFDEHPTARHTSSPLYHDGRIYLGSSSGENDSTDKNYPCCTFRGHLDAIDAETGERAWRFYTMPEPKPNGSWPSGATRYEPAGGGVWSSPVIDERTNTVYVGTGQNYSGSGGDFDSLLALDARTGGVRWKQQVTRSDTWRALCIKPDTDGYCPGLKDGTALDYDIGATPNIFRVNGRTMVGIGQKNGVYHVFDAKTGEVVWRRQLSEPGHGAGVSGVQWGSSYDGEKLYVASYYGNPGTLFALDPANGDIKWQTPSPANGCSWGGAAAHPDICTFAHAPAVTTSPGVVYEGANDGKFRAYSAQTGQVLWEYDTVRDFAGVNGVTGHGGALAGSGGAVVSDGMVYVQSGYWPMYPSEHGTVLLAFGLPRR
ncbi:PQQ-binding-like beta-propeller repeat protein [Amycolatopsis nigrescens]|uniref:outer membrane protein assembly factor BamB family protein n=1 Tax=Amycolatopsis nigrescens TaxID=381445 RepID=UPI00058BDA73|nr:PQQ-binding-like beta-propeller repeat protein [Amycolatopsis nigrescens]